MKNTTERKRKSKGSLSVLDEFTGKAGEISFTPTISDDIQKQIDEKTRLADLPRSTLPPAQSQTDAGSAINLGQTSDNPKTEPRTKPRTIVGQSSDKPRTNLGQTDASKIETSDNPKTEPRTKPRTIVGQSSDKPRTISAFQGLSGLQKNIVLLLYEICRAKGDLVTGPVSIEHLFLKLDSTRLSVQKSIQRLEQKLIIVRKEFRSGRGGWTIYELPKDIWSEILQMETSDKLRTNLGQTSDNPKTEPRTEPRTSPSSSSRDLNISNKSTTQPVEDRLSWIEAINVDSLQGVGITQSVLIRCRELYPMIKPEGLEDLVSRFSVFIKEPKNRVQNARGFFIGLAKQLSEGITPLDHIETANDRLMREFAEKVREKKERQAKFEKEALEFEFESWSEKLSLERQTELIAESQFAKQGSVPYRAALREYFSEKIWPEKKSQILKGNNLAAEFSVFQDNEKI